MNKQKIKDQLQELKTELAYIRGLLVNVSSQLQELRESTIVTSDQTDKLPELYEYPWYKYKREQLSIIEK